MKDLPQLYEKDSPTWVLLRDVGVLQVKLIVDGLRDLLLVPASLIAGLISLLKTSNGRPGTEFYELVSVGKQSERWINLFGALRNAPPEVRPQDRFGNMDMDDLVARVEGFVVAEYQRGGVTAQAKARIDQALATMRRKKPEGET